MKSICVFFTLLFLTTFSTTYCLAQDKKKADKEKGYLANYGLSGDAQLLSHFIVKGLSYSDNNPALNSSFLAHLGTQVKFGFWGSNVSHLNNTDDNFWFKVYTRIKIQLSDKLTAHLFLHDNHFYKSNQRNGQNVGIDFNHGLYEYGLEWLSNFEGSKSNAEYFWFGRLFDYKKNMKYGGYSGATLIHTGSYQSFMDFKVVGQYIINASAYAEAGVTMNSNAAQFGVRDDPAVYIGIKLSY